MASEQLSSSKRLRSSDEHVFLIGKCEEKITGAKLPTKKQVLQFFFHNVRCEKKTVKESAQLVLDEILPFWERARIPTPNRRTCFAKVIKLYEVWRKAQKGHNSPFPSQRKIGNDLKESLNSLFDIAHTNALELMTIPEDRDFLIMQREEGRVGSMIGIDKRLLNKEKRKQERLENEQRRNEKYLANNTSELSITNDKFDDSDFDSDIIGDEGAPSVDSVGGESHGGFLNQPRRVREKKHFIDDRMLACMDAGHMSTPRAMHFISATAKALGHDVQELVLNCTSLRKQRKEFRRRQGQQILDEFNIPQTFVLHWDGKLLPAISGREKVERLALVLTSEKVEKLIAIPIVENASGEGIAQTIYVYLQKMKMVNLLEMVCFDTTATNTGPHNGAGVLLEQKLERNLLWLPCRHHVAELLLKAVFENNFGKTSGPEVAIFERFARRWNSINHNEFSIGIEDENISNSISAEECEVTKQFCFEYLAKEHIRHDYKELLQLSLIFLGGSDPNFTSFRSPGATSHARFMSKALYSFKMYLFHAQFQMTSSQLNGFRNVCIFLVRLYLPYWFGSVNAVEAPDRDLQLIKNIVGYNDLKISLTLLEKMQNHLWYLSEEAVGLAFFDPNVDLDVKRKMVLALRFDPDNDNDIDDEENDAKYSKRVHTNIQELKSYASKDLSNFVTPKTKNFFHRLEIGTNFLLVDPSTWSENEDYCTGAQILKSITVVNDPAERKVKLITDFNRALTHNEEDKQYLLHIVESYRKDYPSYTKSKLL